jgi:uncharacterized protein involved in outer membrane biogenesis
MPKALRISIWAVAIVAALTAFAAVIVPLAVNVDRYRPQAVAQIEAESGKRASIGRLTFRVLPRVAIRVERFTLANPNGFPQGNFVQAKTVDAALDLIQLLHHRVTVMALKFDGLTLDILQNAEGRWNFENARLAPASLPSVTDAVPDARNDALGGVSNISILDGRFRAASLLPSGDRGPALIDVRGVTMNLHKINLNAMTSHSSTTSGAAWAEGAIQAASLASGSLNFSDLNSKIRFEAGHVRFDGTNLKCYGGDASANLSLDFGSANLAYEVDASLRGVKVEQFLDAYPQTRGLLTGIMEGTVKMQGILLKSNDPLEGAHGSGHVTIRDGRMPSLQIAGNLRSLLQFANLGPGNGDPSSFKSLTADFQIADGRLVSDNIHLEGNGLSVRGSGSLTTAGEGTLDYQAEASLAGAPSNPLTAVLGALAGGKITDGTLTVPFTVSGTFAKPRFSLQSGAGNNQNADLPTAEKNNQLLRGLGTFFKKKKQD